jgi:hypothetical protein
MRNQYPGTCYRCGLVVEAGDGHFERHAGGWRTQHATCAIRFRIAPPATTAEAAAARVQDAARPIAGLGRRVARAAIAKATGE